MASGESEACPLSIVKPISTVKIIRGAPVRFSTRHACRFTNRTGQFVFLVCWLHPKLTTRIQLIEYSRTEDRPRGWEVALFLRGSRFTRLASAVAVVAVVGVACSSGGTSVASPSSDLVAAAPAVTDASSATTPAFTLSGANSSSSSTPDSKVKVTPPPEGGRRTSASARCPSVTSSPAGPARMASRR